MNVFLTGGTGLVGRHVIAALTARGDRVTALARSPGAAAALAALGAEPLQGSLAEPDALAGGAARADAVVHAAATVIARGAWGAWQETNVAGTEAVARAAAQRGVRLVYLSSVAVYGRATTYDGGRGSVDEEFGLGRPASPRDFYVRSKREAELALWRIARESGTLKAAALRPCVIYGEGDRHFSPRVARLLSRGLAPVIGRGDNRLSVVYAGNVAAAVVAALDRPDATGPFNITNDGEVTQREFLDHFARGLGASPRPLRVPLAAAHGAARLWDAVAAILPLPRPMRVGQAVAWLASENPYTSSRAERVLGWRPRFPAPDAVEKTGASFRIAPSRGS